MKVQARQREEAWDRERAREQERLRDEKAKEAREVDRLVEQLRESRDELGLARDQIRRLDLEIVEGQHAVIAAQYEVKHRDVELHGKSRLYVSISMFLLVLLVVVGGYTFFQIANLTREVEVARVEAGRARSEMEKAQRDLIVLEERLKTTSDAQRTK